jgi:hypothetical protein
MQATHAPVAKATLPSQDLDAPQPQRPLPPQGQGLQGNWYAHKEDDRAMYGQDASMPAWLWVAVLGVGVWLMTRRK